MREFKLWWASSPWYVRGMIAGLVVAGAILSIGALSFRGDWRVLDTMAIASGVVMFLIAVSVMLLYVLIGRDC